MWFCRSWIVFVCFILGLQLEFVNRIIIESPKVLRAFQFVQFINTSSYHLLISAEAFRTNVPFLTKNHFYSLSGMLEPEKG